MCVKVMSVRDVCCTPNYLHEFFFLFFFSYTSLISGSSNRLSVIRVMVVSVNVDFVIVSVTKPSSVGAGGSIGMSGVPFLTVTVTADPPCSTVGEVLCSSKFLPPLRKCEGIIAWKSSLVMGRGV